MTQHNFYFDINFIDTVDINSHRYPNNAYSSSSSLVRRSRIPDCRFVSRLWFIQSPLPQSEIKQVYNKNKKRTDQRIHRDVEFHLSGKELMQMTSTVLKRAKCALRLCRNISGGKDEWVVTHGNENTLGAVSHRMIHRYGTKQKQSRGVYSSVPKLLHHHISKVKRDGKIQCNEMPTNYFPNSYLKANTTKPTAFRVTTLCSAKNLLKCVNMTRQTSQNAYFA